MPVFSNRFDKALIVSAIKKKLSGSESIGTNHRHLFHETGACGTNTQNILALRPNCMRFVHLISLEGLAIYK